MEITFQKQVGENDFIDFDYDIDVTHKDVVDYLSEWYGDRATIENLMSEDFFDDSVVYEEDAFIDFLKERYESDALDAYQTSKDYEEECKKHY